MDPRRTAWMATLTVALSALVGPLAQAQMPWNPIDLSVSVSKRVLFPDDRDTTVMVDLAGRDGPTQRTPVAMAIVIDTSGSMDGQKIADARAAAHALVDRLADGDLLTIVTYSDAAQVVWSNAVVGSDRSGAHAAIEGIRATGATCISCGLDEAYRSLAVAAGEFNTRVVVLSDGNANRGTSDSPGLHDMASAALEGHAVPTSTIGLGFDYNEDLMTAIANGGAGSYYFLADSDAIATILDREFEHLGQVVAGNVTLELTPTHGVTFGPTTAPGVENVGSALHIHLGQIGSGTHREILVPLNLPTGELGDVLQVRATYTAPDGRAGDMSVPVSLERSTDPSAVSANEDARVMERVQQVQATRTTEAALDAYHHGNRGAGRAQLEENARQLREAAQSQGSPTLSQEATQVESLIEYLDDEEPSETQIEGLERHNRARRVEVEAGTPAPEMYYDQTVPAQ